jgi:LPXTG-motif cell wall-anchored protein
VKSFVKRGVIPLLPVVLLLGLTSAGLANAFQADDEEGPDLGPQPADYGGDLTSYLVGAAEYRAAAKVAATTVDGESALTFAAAGCTEGSPITISFVPRLLAGDEAAANDTLADDDPAKLVQEPVVAVEEAEALAEGSTYDLTVPANLPLGFTRIRVDCLGADGEELTSDTVIDLVDPVVFAEEQASAEEPVELATTIEGKPAAVPTAPTGDGAAAADDGTTDEAEELPATGAETSLLIVIGAAAVAGGAMLFHFGRRFRRA